MLTAKLLVPLGAPLQLRAGDRLPPVQPNPLNTCSLAMVAPSLMSALVRVMLCALAALAPSAPKPNAPSAAIHCFVMVTSSPSMSRAFAFVPLAPAIAIFSGVGKRGKRNAKAYPASRNRLWMLPRRKKCSAGQRIPGRKQMNEATRIRPPATELGASGDEFQNLHEFVRKARANLNQNAWDYIVGAAETETTMRRNRMALDEIAFRPRVLRNVAKVDASVEVFGRKLRLPVMLAPVGALEIFDPGGAASVARGAGTFGAAHMLSSVSEPGLEKVAEAAPDA